MSGLFFFVFFYAMGMGTVVCMLIEINLYCLNCPGSSPNKFTRPYADNNLNLGIYSCTL